MVPVMTETRMINEKEMIMVRLLWDLGCRILDDDCCD